MAGIGFRLQKLLEGESYTALMKAYAFSAMVACGPMLVVIATIATVNIFARTRLAIEELTLFNALIVYIYAFSLVITGPVIYIVTRYLADKYYLKQRAAFTGTYLSSLILIFFVQSVASLAFLSLIKISATARWLYFCLSLFVSGIWLAMLALSAARNYTWIILAFFMGGVVGVVLGIFLGNRFGFEGFLAGCTVAQGVIFFIVTARIFLEFGCESFSDFGFLEYFKRHPYLVLVGLFYSLGIWADKYIFWFSNHGEWVADHVRMCPDYDTPMFLAYLTVVPSMAFFLVQMETSFVRYYHAYYESIRNRESLPEINARKLDMIDCLSLSFKKFVVFQGLITALVIFLVYPLAEAFHLRPNQMGIFRIAVLGSFLQIAFIMILNVYFYFDFQKEAFWLALVYFTSNVLFTTLSLYGGIAAYGYGFTGASFITLVFGYLVMDHKLKNLHYWTFMTQPIVVPRFKYESETR